MRSLEVFSLNALSAYEESNEWALMSAIVWQVTVAGLLDNPARIVSSFQVCASWVHVVDAILWPASSPDPASIPDPAAGGSFPAGQPQTLSTAQSLW